MTITAINTSSDAGASNAPARLVLVIDRDEHARFIYRSILQHAGFDVATATACDAGVHVCRHTTPAAIVLDVDPPTSATLDGPRALAADPKLRSTTLVALTRRAMLHELRDIHALGFDSILVKPIDPKRVLDAVRGEFGGAG